MSTTGLYFRLCKARFLRNAEIGASRSIGQNGLSPGLSRKVFRGQQCGTKLPLSHWVVRKGLAFPAGSEGTP